MWEHEQAGDTSSERYQKLSERFDRLSNQEEQSEVSEFNLGDLVSAVQDDAGAVAAEFVNAIAADPELLAVPFGSKKLAVQLGERVASMGRTAQVMARVAGGSLGAAGTGAAVAIPISVADQAANEGSVDWGKVYNDAAMTAMISAPIGGIFGGATLPPVRARVTRPRPITSVGAAETVSPSSTLEEAIQSILETPKRFSREIGDVIGYKAVTYLDDASKVSPSMKTIRNIMEYQEFSDTPIAPSFYERLSLANGQYLSQLQDAMGTFTKTFRRGLTKTENDDLVKHLRGITEGSGKVAEAGKVIRGMLDDIQQYAKDAGLETGYVENYFPRVYNDAAGSDEFVKTLSKHMPIEDATEVQRRIVNNDGILLASRTITDRAVDDAGVYMPGRVLQGGVKRNRNAEMSRKLTDIPEEELAPFLEGNAYDVLRKYVSGITRRSEYAREFGAGEEKLNQLVRSAIEEGHLSGRPIRPKEIQRVYELADALQLSYKPIQSSVMRGINKGFGAYQLLRTLSLATISSLSEPLVILSRGRWKSALKAVPKMIDHAIHGAIGTVFKRFPQSEATKALERVGIGLDIAVTERLMASFGGEVTRATNAFFKATLLHQWTRMNRVWGFHSGRLMVVDHLKDLAKGKGGRTGNRLRQELAELGVSADEGIRWVQSGAKDEGDFKRVLDAAALRFTNEVVMNPRATVRPMWHANPHFHLISQLRGFQTTFGNTVMKRWFKKIVEDPVHYVPKISATGVLMTVTAYWANELREVIKYGPDGNPNRANETEAEKLTRAIDRAGFTGAGQIAADVLFAHRFGSSGLQQALGPQISQIEELREGVAMALEGNSSKLSLELANAIPVANTYRPARDAIREMVEEAVE
jgi:hypothetical protein